MTDASFDVRIARLARSFPSLICAPEIFDPAHDLPKLDHWAANQRIDANLSFAERQARACAAAFVLAVWDQWSAWDVGPFNLIHAMKWWFDGDKKAFCAWCADPWQR